MKRYVVDKQRLESLYPEMDERFERNLRAMIDTLPAKKARRRAMMKPRYAAAFALALMLLCARSVISRSSIALCAHLRCLGP